MKNLLMLSLFLFAGFVNAQKARDTDKWPAFVVPWNDTVRSATDMSHFLHKPAGKYGTIEVKDGKFMLGNGERWRIWGTNITLGAALPPVADAPLIARRMAKYGINCVRFHHIDHRWPDGIIMRHSTGTRAPMGRDMGVPWDGRGESTRALDPEAMARLDWFIYQLSLNGIYTNLNITVSRNVTEADGVVEAGLLGYGKASTYFDKHLIKLQKEYLSQLLEHVNPFTGKRYAEDPTIAMIELLNENSVIAAWQSGFLHGVPEYPANWSKIPPYYSSQLDSMWNKWLLKKYKSQDQLRSAWENDLEENENIGENVRRLTPKEFGESNHNRLQDEMNFYMEIEEEYAREMKEFIRERIGSEHIVGVTAAFGGGNSNMYPTLKAQDKHIKMSHGHAYWEGYWGTPNLRRDKRPAKEWFQDWYLSPNTSVIDNPEKSLPCVLSSYKVKGKPYFIGEINHHWPNDYSAETFPFNTAYAMLQDWDGIYWFGYAGSDWEGVFNFSKEKPLGQEVLQTQALTRFEWYGNDPVKMSLSAISAHLWYANNIKAAEQIVERTVNDKRMTEILKGDKKAPFHHPGVEGTLALKHRTQISDFKADKILPTKKYLNEAGDIISDTKELKIVKGDSSNVFIIDTEKHQGITGHAGTHSCSNLQLELETPFASVQLCALDGKAISDSKELLLVAASRVANTAMVWKDGLYPSVSDWGREPTRIEPVTGHVNIKTNHIGKALIVPLNGRGEENKEGFEAEVQNGNLSFQMPGSYSTVWFAIRF